MIHIIKNHQITYVIPTFEEIFCISKYLDRFPKSCRIFASSYDILDSLHNKWLFIKKLNAYGFQTVQSYLIKQEQDFGLIPFNFPIILKPAYSRAAQQIIHISSKEELSPLTCDRNNPWVAQEWLKGEKFCSYSIAHQGKITAHTIYPVELTIDGHSCLNFKALNHPIITNWVTEFIKKERFTGQIAFDFIELPNQRIYAIECNPRATSGLHLFQKHDNLPSAFFNQNQIPIYPQLGYQKQIAVAVLVYRKNNQKDKINWNELIKRLLRTKDVIFTWQDLKPFLAQPLLFTIYLLKSLKMRISMPKMFTFDIDWNGTDKPINYQDKPREYMKRKVVNPDIQIKKKQQALEKEQTKDFKQALTESDLSEKRSISKEQIKKKHK